MMKTNPARLTLAVLAGASLALCAWYGLARLYGGRMAHPGGLKTVAQRQAELGPAARARLASYFREAGVAYPPARVTLVGLKEEERLEVWAGAADAAWRLIRAYPILAASGTLGPKLREGDRQVPEGLYRIESLNPNSRFHLALRVNYPNEEDRRIAATEGRANLGGDIMIHGGNASIGCLAMGDEAAEDLFILAADTSIESTRVILTPVDFRVRELPANTPAAPEWVAERYGTIRAALGKLVNAAGNGADPQMTTDGRR